MIGKLSLRRPNVVPQFLVVALLILSTLGSTILVASSRITILAGIVIAAAPWAILAAALRPDLLLLALVALPGQFTAGIQTSYGVAVVAVALVGLVVLRGGLPAGFGSALSALAIIVIAGYAFRADVQSEALAKNAALTKDVLYYLLLALLAYNLAIRGELHARQLGTALLFGMGTTLVISWTGFSSSWFPTYDLFLSKTSFAYFAAAGLGVTVGRAVDKSDSETKRSWNRVLLAVCLLLVTLSFVRAAWVAALATIVFLSDRLGRRRYILLVIMVAVLLVWIPTTRKEIASTKSGDLVEAFRSGEITTGRWDLWVELWDRRQLPWGRGFGYMWSLSSEELFGPGNSFLTEGSDTVYPHNDFLILALEFGIVGIGLLVLFWGALLRKLFKLVRDAHPPHRYTALVLAGMIMTGLVVTLVDNLFAIRPIAERFFPVAGFLLATAASRPPPEPWDVPSTSPDRSGRGLGVDSFQ